MAHRIRSVILTPTKDKRHTSKIRFGKISHEVFTKNPERREELGLPKREQQN